MSPLVTLSLLLIACDPVPTVPVPVAQPEPSPVVGPAELVAEPVEDTAPPVERNRPPVILTIEVEPGAPRTGEDIKVRVEAEDPEGDHVRYEYSWFVNEREIRGQRQPTLSHNYYAKGDEIRARVLAKDRAGETEGATPVIIVRNTPPEILNKPGSLRKVDGFQIKAQDADSDTLSFRLEGAPEGMSIGSSDGTLSYTGSEGAKAGDYRVDVIVEDPDQGSAKWSFGISVSAGSEADKPAEGDEPAEG